ncbi:MAG: hypothetical protein ACREIU_14060 [Planctomycetota bacterium]
MTRRISAALLAAPLLGACYVTIGNGDLPRYTVVYYEGKVLRVNCKTGEVWVHDGTAWKSLGGGMHQEGGAGRVGIDGASAGKRNLGS